MVCMRGNVGLTLTLNNLLSTHSVPGFVLKAGGTKRTKGLLCPAPGSSEIVKMTITTQCDDPTRMLLRELLGGH